MISRKILPKNFHNHYYLGCYHVSPLHCPHHESTPFFTLSNRHFPESLLLSYLFIKRHKTGILIIRCLALYLIKSIHSSQPYFCQIQIVLLFHSSFSTIEVLAKDLRSILIVHTLAIKDLSAFYIVLNN
jgi:hypothetical protein